MDIFSTEIHSDISRSLNAPVHGLFGSVYEIEFEMIEQLKKVFLLVNNADRGSVDYVSVKEIDDTLIGSIIVDSPAIN